MILMKKGQDGERRLDSSNSPARGILIDGDRFEQLDVAADSLQRGCSEGSREC